MTARALVIAAYAVLALAAVFAELAGRTRRLGLVPVAALLDAVRATRVGRFVVLVAWAWLGWHLLAR
jgi:hypothetical protein